MVPEQGLKKALWRKAYLGRKKKKKKEDNEQQNFKQSYCCLPTPDNGSHHEVKKQ